METLDDALSLDADPDSEPSRDGGKSTGPSGGPTPASANRRAPVSVREAEHRIANHLTMLAAIVRIRVADASGREGTESIATVAALAEIAAQIEAVAHLHLLLTPGRPVGDLDLGNFLEAACGAFRDLHGGAVSLSFEFPRAVRVPAARVLPIGQVVVEAVTNAVKHAAGRERHRILIRGRRQDAGVVIEVVDFGSSCTPRTETPRNRGRGRSIIRELAASIGASTDCLTTPFGTTFRLTVPAARDP